VVDLPVAMPPVRAMVSMVFSYESDVESSGDCGSEVSERFFS